MADEIDFKFDGKLRQAIHQDWGNYYKRIGKNQHAKKQFLDTLSLKKNAEVPMEQLSKCYLDRADTQTALEYANDCLKNYPKIKRAKYHRNECIYDSNEFERCLVECYRLRLENQQAKDTLNAIKITELTIEQSIGNEIGPFLDNFRGAINELDKIQSVNADNRPVWKIRREKGECDVVSISSDSIESTEPNSNMHPIHLCRVRRKNKIFRTMYLSSPTTKTIDYLNRLITDRRLDLRPFEESKKTIRNAVDEELGVVKKFEFMLRQRQPIYAKKAIRNKRNANKFSDATLVRMRVDVESQAEKQIKRIGLLRQSDFLGLRKYVEDILSNFYPSLTLIVFPKKLEFLERICNIIGTSYMEMIKPPSKTPSNIYLLLDSTVSTTLGVAVPRKFNNEPGFKNPIDHFMNRLQFSENSIEKCYIYHELSRLYFDNQKFIESKEMGEEILKIADPINTYVWNLLGRLRVILVDVWLSEFDSVENHLETIMNERHAEDNISNFLELLTSLTDAQRQAEAEIQVEPDIQAESDIQAEPDMQADEIKVEPDIKVEPK